MTTKPLIINLNAISLRQQQLALILCIIISCTVVASQSEGDTCTTQSGSPGKCLLQSECDNLRELMRKNEPPVTCGFGVFEEVICCPRKQQPSGPQGPATMPLMSILASTTTSTQANPIEGTAELDGRTTLTDLADIFEQLVRPSNPTTSSKSGNIGSLDMANPFLPPKANENPWLNAKTPSEPTLENNNFLETSSSGGSGQQDKDDAIIFPSELNHFLWKSTTQAPVITRSKERAAVEACIEIDKGLTPALTPHIIGGVSVPLGEYPHMAALGFPVIGSDEFDFRCGGSLIDARFVLTAAHCVIRRDSSPTIVRLGFVNFNDEEQTRDALEIPIQQIHIHPNYTNSRSYNDIAILELERNASFSSRVYPVCLNTQAEDPPTQSDLYVTGWGVKSTATRSTSSVLLKAKLKIRSVEQCNSSYASSGQRQLPHGLDNTQMCAYDPGGTRDACQGDSGGPLNLVVDESLLKYRLVGITSAGFSCGTVAPSLYTRVSAFLDFIESIVWPRNNPS